MANGVTPGVTSDGNGVAPGVCDTPGVARPVSDPSASLEPVRGVAIADPAPDPSSPSPPPPGTGVASHRLLFFIARGVCPPEPATRGVAPHWPGVGVSYKKGPQGLQKKLLPRKLCGFPFGGYACIAQSNYKLQELSSLRAYLASAPLSRSGVPSTSFLWL